MTDPAPTDAAGHRAGTPRTLLIVIGSIDAAIGFLIFLAGFAAEAMVSRSQQVPVEALAASGLFLGVPAAAYWLYNGTQVETRWIALLLWAPIFIGVIFMLVVIQKGF